VAASQPEAPQPKIFAPLFLKSGCLLFFFFFLVALLEPDDFRSNREAIRSKV
jgi:hypothetical protein